MDNNDDECEWLIRSLATVDANIQRENHPIVKSKLAFLSALYEQAIMNQYEFAKSEIDIVVESFQMILNDIGEAFKQQLNESRDSVTKTFDSLVPDREDIQTQIESINVNAIARVNESKMKLSQLQMKLDELRRFNLKIEFIQNDSFKIDQDQLGSLYSSQENILNRLKSTTDFNWTIQLDYKPNDMILLSNGHILVGSWRDKVISEYNDDFTLIRTIKTLQANGNTMAPRGLVGCTYRNLFTINTDNYTIVKFNENLELLKSTRQSDENFYNDLCVANDKIYACVLDRNRIDILTLDLEMIASHYLHDEPNRIRIINNCACVLVKGLGKKNQKLCFFRLPTFELVRTCEPCRLILAHDGLFYVLDNDYLKSYDKNGKLLCQKNTNYGYANGISIIHNKLYFCLYGRKLGRIDIEV